MDKPLNQIKMSILSFGSLLGMFIGSIVTYFFPNSIIFFVLVFLFGLFGVRQLYLRGMFH